MHVQFLMKNTFGTNLQKLQKESGVLLLNYRWQLLERKADMIGLRDQKEQNYLKSFLGKENLAPWAILKLLRILGKLIKKALANVSHGRTSLVVAHRLSTIVNSNKIVVVDDGRIIEIGTHLQLIENEGLYTKLYKQELDKK